MSSDETQAEWGGSMPSISGTGRFVVFGSISQDLVPGDPNGLRSEVYVRDRTNATTALVSVGHDGSRVAGNSYAPTVSANGRYVSFSSDGATLDPADTDQQRDVFVRDLATNSTRLVSLSSEEVPGDRPSGTPSSISASGRYVVFESSASNLVDDDLNRDTDLFVRDLVAGTTSRVSLSSSEAEGNATSIDPTISSDGRYVAFESVATNLVPGDTNFRWDYFVRDRATGTTERVSVSSSEAQANQDACCNGGVPAISANGRYVAFTSEASNLVAGDTNKTADVFVRDRVNGTTRRVSVRSNGAQQLGARESSVERVSMSSDGRYIAFTSAAGNLVSGDTNQVEDVFVHDRVNRTTHRVSLTARGAQTRGGHSGESALSPDARHMAFVSLASNLVPADTNGRTDVFVWELTR